MWPTRKPRTTVDAADTSRAAPSARQLRQWVTDINLTNLPSFVTSEQFLDSIAQQRQRPITLREAPGLPADLCGLWMALDDADIIVIDDQLTGPRRDLVILHEAAHVLCDHRGDANLVPQPASPLLRALTPDADPTSVLYRSHFDDEQEWQAEWLATHFLARTRGTHRSAWVDNSASRYAARMLYGND